MEIAMPSVKLFPSASKNKFSPSPYKSAKDYSPLRQKSPDQTNKSPLILQNSIMKIENNLDDISEI